METSQANPFLKQFKGSFVSILRWPQLDALWQTLRKQNDGQWYLYAVGEAVPTQPAGTDQLDNFISEIDTLLRREHDEDYCGIVYVDDTQSPTFIKIYDPNNLGVSCGFSLHPPLPGWILCRAVPSDLAQATAPPAGRRRWWQRLFTVSPS